MTCFEKFIDLLRQTAKDPDGACAFVAEHFEDFTELLEKHRTAGKLCRDSIVSDATELCFRAHPPKWWWGPITVKFRPFPLGWELCPNKPLTSEQMQQMSDDIARAIFHTLLDERASGNPPESEPSREAGCEPSPPRLELDEVREQFCIGDRWYSFRGQQAALFLRNLLKSPGEFQPGKVLLPPARADAEPPRADQVYKKLPRPIRKIIERRRGAGGGYRIKPKYLPVVEQ